MATTYSFTTDAVGDDETITVQSPQGCHKIVLYENAQTGTADYLIRMPNSTSPQITRPAGAKTEITALVPWRYGAVVGYVSAASGSLTMVQEEYS